MEIWKDIKGFEGKYQVSNLGKVKGVDRYIKHYKGDKSFIKGVFKKERLNKYGYYRLNLKVNGKSYDKTIHNLVALAFINNPLNKKQVNHINGIKTDNRVENLEWCTAKENIKHAVKNRLIKTKLTDKQALEIYNSSETQRFLGNKYNVNPVIVWRIKNKKAYKHIF